MDEFSIYQPTYLIGGLIVIATVAGWIAHRRKKLEHYREELFPDRERELISSKKTAIPSLIKHAPLGLMTILLLLVLALAKPFWGYRKLKIPTGTTDVMLIFDVSLSMLAEDLKPNRLEFAKRKLTKFIDELRNQMKGSRPRIGIVIFAGSSYLFCPLTSDLETIRYFLESASPDLITHGGSSLSEALKITESSFEVSPSNTQVAVLITDGEDHEGELGALSTQADQLSSVLLTYGVGTLTGAPITLPNGRFLQDSTGEIVVSRLAEEQLKEITSARSRYQGQNRYIASSLSDQDLRVLSRSLIETIKESTPKQLGRALGQIEEAKRDEKENASYLKFPNQIGFIFCLAGLFLALLSALPRKSNRANWFLGLLLLFGPVAKAEDTRRSYQASLAYQAGDYEEAYRLFKLEQDKNPDPKVLESLAASAFKLNKHSEAIKLYDRLLKKARSKQEKTRLLYNRGNSYLAQNELDSAIADFRSALKISPKQPQIEHNLSVALARKSLTPTPTPTNTNTPSPAQTPNSTQTKPPETTPSPEKDGSPTTQPSPKNDETQSPSGTPEATETAGQNSSTQQPPKTASPSRDGSPTPRSEPNRSASPTPKPQTGVTPEPNQPSEDKEEDANENKDLVEVKPEWLESLPEAPLLLRRAPNDRKRKRSSKFW